MDSAHIIETPYNYGFSWLVGFYGGCYYGWWVGSFYNIGTRLLRGFEMFRSVSDRFLELLKQCFIRRAELVVRNKPIKVTLRSNVGPAWTSGHTRATNRTLFDRLGEISYARNIDLGYYWWPMWDAVGICDCSNVFGGIMAFHLQESLRANGAKRETLKCRFPPSMLQKGIINISMRNDPGIWSLH